MQSPPAVADSVPAERRRLPILTGYRFVLASVVLFAHTFYHAQFFRTDPQTDPFRLTLLPATAAVSSFFVLSGFILTWSAPPSDPPRAFWRRRAAKIFPNHVLTWLVTILFLATISTPSLLPGAEAGLDAGTAFINLVLLQNWVPRIDYLGSVNPVSWSISCEAFFYALFPFLHPRFQRIPAHRLWRWFALVAALIVLFPALTYLLREPHTGTWWMPLPITQVWLVYFFPPTRLLEFILGILAARLVQARLWPRLPLWPPLLLGGLVFLAIPILPTAYLFGAALAVPLAMVIPTLATRDLAGHTGWLGHPVLIALGNASYALYLVHYPVLRIFRHAVGPQQRFAWWSGTLLALAAMAISIVVAVLMYTHLEEPIVRRHGRRRHVATDGPGATGIP
ncbi:acyltransferase family protein [Chondromyces crocatus]|uniref:Acyltransferase n=1 Tax=Chondromyces crocatus TaxID=52 RepID=A0A0K1EB68_CHOCO|nr:acyltransferase [Chondromyces crocatus]AKT38089.1 acyltransferase [Chondromyces crocatus]